MTAGAPAAISPGLVFLAVALIGSVRLRGLRGDGPRRVADPAAGGRRRGRSGSSSSRSPSTRCARPGGPGSTGRSGQALGARGRWRDRGRSSAPAAWPARSSCSCCRQTPHGLTEPGPDPLVDSGRPVPPSSRGLGRHPFKVEIRGSNPLGGTSTPATGARPRPPLLPSIAMEIMGIQIRTIVKDNVAIRCDGCLEVIDGTPVAGQPARHRRGRGAGRLDRPPDDQPGPVPVPPRPGHVRRWMAGKGYLFCRRGEVREIMRPVADPDRSARSGACATASIATITSSSQPDPRVPARVVDDPSEPV